MVKLIMKLKKIIEKVYQILGERKSFTINKKPIRGGFIIADTVNYTLYKYAYKADKIIAAYGEMTVLQKGKTHLVLYPYVNKAIHYHIHLEKKLFPGLIEGSKILSCQLVPYMREVDLNKYKKLIRLVIITDKGQIYHNFPARKKEIEGLIQSGDIIKFEESVVWDLPERFYPSLEKNCKKWERYYPGLPRECYEYHPICNNSVDFKDEYNNGGFSDHTEIEEDGKRKIVPRFYMYSRENEAANPFYFIGTGEKDYKMSVMATYRSNTCFGVRTCIFISSDGGRNWYCKYEFTDAGEYNFTQGDSNDWGKNFGNPIIDPELERIDWSKIEIYKRKVIVPSFNNKEPVNKFSWHKCGKIKQGLSKEQLILTFEESHFLKTGNIIVFTTKDSKYKDCWLINNYISEISSGNNLMFKVNVINEVSISLYEFVSSPSNNIPCRHIHHINRIKDGWIWGTGEIYPNGWIMYMQMKEADTFAIKHAWEEFKIIRLNSTENSIQRTMGVILKDDKKGTLLFASDHDTLTRDEVLFIKGRTVKLSRNSVGVFKGSISDIDNRNNFEVIYEALEPCFYFQSLDNMLIFSGQRGEFAISFDEGLTWKKERIPEPLIQYYGNCGQVYYFDQIILVRK